MLGLGGYRAYVGRRLDPVIVAFVIPGWGALLAAPKLLPVVDTMRRFPRTIHSSETVDPMSWLRMFLASVDSVPNHHALGLDYMWHEYGQYIGVFPLALILWTNLRKLPADTTLRSLRFVGWAFMALALGGCGPWVVLHLIPPFRSQHVPTRFTYPALLLLVVVAAAVVERSADTLRATLGSRRFDVAVWTAFGVSALLIGREDMRCTLPWFGIVVPEGIHRSGNFVQYAAVPPEYAYGDGDPESPGGTNGAQGLLVRWANVGAIRCMESAGLNEAAPRGVDGRPLHLGARGRGDPLYRGESWIEPSGRVDVARWSPSEVVLSVRDAPAGALLVFNQNWDPGWTANGNHTENRDDLNVHRLVAPDETVVFRYRPRCLPAALCLLALALVVPGASMWWRPSRFWLTSGRKATVPLDDE